MEAAQLCRRLAAVLIADVAGYARLMEREEGETHVRISALLSEVVQPTIARNNGRVLRIVGDGVLAEFPSATDAVRCGVEIQRQTWARNRDVPALGEITFRIGINVADILFDSSDIAGGGVNLAARLEQLAPPGGICISQTVRDQIHDDLGVLYLDAGYRRVKNIGKPVRVVRVLFNPPTPFERLRISFGRFPFHTLGIVATAATVLIIGAAFVFDRPEHMEPEKLSLQVGEFKAVEPEDVEAARIGKLFAQRIYLALSPDRHLVRIKESQPAETLVLRQRPLARYVVEGVITRLDGDYQVEARLLDSQNRESLWGDRFRLTETAVSSVATGAHRIAHGVHHEVLQTETRRLTASPPRRPDSMDLVLMGSTAKKGKNGADAARRLFEMALNLDAAHVPALLALSSVSEDGDIDRLTQKAVAIDPLCADAWANRSEILWRLGQTDAAREAVTRALRINPANLRAIAELHRQLMNDGQWDRVIRPLEDVEFEFGKSGALSWMLGIQCRARLLAGQHSAQACDRSFAVSGSRASLVYATAALARNENEENALRAGARLKARHPELTIAAFRREIESSKQYSSEYREQMERVVYPALERSGIPNG